MKRRALELWLITTAARPLLWLVSASWRVSIEGIEHDDRCRREGVSQLWAFRHGRLLLAARAGRGRDVGVMVSRHGDGELIDRVARAWGYRTYRGSTTRGGIAALLEMCRASPQTALAITPDGPRGPDGSVQPGVILLAEKSARVVLPVGLAAAPAWRARSWDRFVIPKPFARIQAVVRPPLRIPGELSRREREGWADTIRREIEAAEARAWELVEKR